MLYIYITAKKLRLGKYVCVCVERTALLLMVSYVFICFFPTSNVVQLSKLKEKYMLIVVNLNL